MSLFWFIIYKSFPPSPLPFIFNKILTMATFTQPTSAQINPVPIVASTNSAGMRQFVFTVDGSNLCVEIAYVSQDASALKFCSDSKYSSYIPPPQDVELYCFNRLAPVLVFADCFIFVHTQSYILSFKKREVLKILCPNDVRLANVFGAPQSLGSGTIQPAPVIIFREIIRDTHGEEAFRFMPFHEARSQQPSLFGSIPISTNPFPEARPTQQSDCLFGSPGTETFSMCMPKACQTREVDNITKLAYVPLTDMRPQPVPPVRQVDPGHYMCQSHIIPLPHEGQIFFD
jgi:hypothetical protein